LVLRLTTTVMISLLTLPLPSSPTRFGARGLPTTIDFALLKNINLFYNIEVLDALSCIPD
jgi:hypothetical protein